MAVMFPKNINELDPQDSELEVYNQFRKQLDDSYTVFYSVEWNRKRKDGSLEKSEADFIVASPKYGFLCLEVKGVVPELILMAINGRCLIMCMVTDR